MTALSAAATLRAELDDPAGMRAEKSPRCTADRMRSIVVLSILSAPFTRWAVLLTAVLVAIFPSSFLAY
jgi:hypothetical protein